MNSRQIKFLPALFLMTVSGVVSAAGEVVPAAEQDWRHYTNERFGFSVDVPEVGFYPQEAPANSDGRTFLNEAGDVEIRVFGANWTASAADFTDYRAHRRQVLDEVDAEITYAPSGETWFVYTGFLESDIFYVKGLTRAGCDVAAHIFFTFPEDERPDMSGIVERMEDTLRLDESPPC